jgi:hypothetical protein
LIYQKRLKGTGAVEELENISKIENKGETGS